MTERAAHLVDHVFPPVPVRQSVWTRPHRLRYRLAWDHDLCRAAALRPFENLRVAVSLVERRRCSGPSRAASRDGGHLRLIALIDEAAVIGRVLRQLGLPTEIPAPHPARAPPLPFEGRSRRHSGDEIGVDSCG